MELIADIFLVAGSIGAAVYCFILGKRLKKFNSLEKGVGGAVALLSTQVEDLKATLESAQQTASVSAETLADLNVRAEEISKRLEIQLASLHDLPELTRDMSPADRTDEPSVERTEIQNSAPTEPMFIRHAMGAAE